MTQYYTDYNFHPVKKIVLASRTGSATNIIAGLRQKYSLLKKTGQNGMEK